MRARAVQAVVIAGVVIAMGIFLGKLVAINNSFSSSNINVGANEIRIDPVADVKQAGTKFGLPLFEMQNQFFIKIAYECGPEVEVIKDGTPASASSPYRSGKLCYQTFRSQAKMSGDFTIKILYNGNSYSKNVEIRRRDRLSCPLWDMMISA